MTNLEKGSDMLVHRGTIQVFPGIEVFEKIVRVYLRKICLMNFLQLIPHSYRSRDAIFLDEGQLRILAGSLDVPHRGFVSKFPIQSLFSCQALFGFRSIRLSFGWTFFLTSNDQPKVF